MAHFRLALGASIASVVVLIAACSSFSPDASGGVGADASGSDGDPGGDGSPPGSGDASPNDAKLDGIEGDGDADAASCAIDTSYTTTVTGGTLVLVNKDGVSAQRAEVIAAGQQATLVRDVALPSDGFLTVSVTFELTAGSSAFSGWDVPFLVLACTAPPVNVTLDYGPGAVITANVSNGAAAGVGAPSGAFQTVNLAIQDNKVFVTGLAQAATLTTTDHFAGAKGCSLTLGPKAIGNIPNVDVYLAQACVY